MAPYLVLLAFPSVLSLLSRRRVSLIGMIPAFIFFVFFAGFRFKVGMDWNNYEAIHRTMGLWAPDEILLGREPLSNLLFWVSQEWTGGSVLTNFVAGLILVVGVFALARRTVDPWLAIVVATPYVIIAFGMSGIRQAMALGVFFVVLSKWGSLGTLKRLAGIFVASLFHTSAIALAVLAVADMKLPLQYRIIFGSVALAAGIYFVTGAEIYADNIAFYQQTYVGSDSIVTSSGAILHLVLVVFPSLAYLILKKRVAKNIVDIRIFEYGLFGVAGVCALYFISDVGASRMSVYFHFVPMMFYAAAARMYGVARLTDLRIMIIALHFVILVLWLLYANNSFAHLPYRNYWFEN